VWDLLKNTSHIGVGLTEKSKKIKFNFEISTTPQLSYPADESSRLHAVGDKVGRRNNKMAAYKLSACTEVSVWCNYLA
jgi:hypothetical protein